VLGHEVADADGAHPAVSEELPVAYETLVLASTPDVRIVTYLADPGTPSADALDLLRSWIATTSTDPVPPGSQRFRRPANASGDEVPQ